MRCRVSGGSLYCDTAHCSQLVFGNVDWLSCRGQTRAGIVNEQLELNGLDVALARAYVRWVQNIYGRSY